MATPTQFTEEQLQAAHKKAFHQAGEPLLTLDAARTWIEGCGLIAFAPLPQLGAPAPSLVEATLGETKSDAAAADADVARALLARLVAEGSALPLNLLGTPGDAPDFVVSAAAFPFVFTLRGDKGWKRAPETSGAVRVTPLVLRVYELLAEKGALGAGEIVSDVGREVTESAVMRALSELWAMLRVLPLYPQNSGEPVLWELTTRRFLKAVKAGANAGQPTALSALVSLYLGQVHAASEEEVISFLSPLTARSRVREVLHGLTAARELNEIVLDGETLLYIPETLPDFAAVAPEEEADEETGDESSEAVSDSDELSAEAAPAERIGRFKPSPSARGGELRGKPTRREDGERPARPRFDRPWQESGERPERPRRDSSTFGQRDGGEGADRRAPRKPFVPGSRPPFRGPAREGGDSRPFRPVGDRPFRPRGGDGEGRPARPFTPRDGGGGRPFRPRPTGEGRPFTPRDRDGGGDRPFRPRPSGESRPFTPRNREGGGDRPFRPRPSGEGRPFTPREGGGGDRSFRKPRPEGGGEARPPFRKPFGRPEGGDRDRSSFAPRSPRPFSGSREGGGEDRPRKPFGQRREGGYKPAFGQRDGGEGTQARPPRKPFGAGARPPFRRSDGEGGDSRPTRPSGPGGRPSFGARKPFGAGGDRPSGFSRAGGRPGGGGGGFKRPGGAGGFSKPGGFGGPRKPGPGGPRKPGPGGPPRRRPEEE